MRIATADGIFVVNKPTCVDDYGNVVPTERDSNGRITTDDTYVDGPTGGLYSVFGGRAYGDHDAPVDLATPEGRDEFGDDDDGGRSLIDEGFVRIYDYLTGEYTLLADLRDEYDANHIDRVLHVWDDDEMIIPRFRR